MTDFTTYDEKQQLSNGVWVINRNNTDWDRELNKNFEILNDLCNKKTLTIKDTDGNILVEFDGTENKEVIVGGTTINNLDVEFEPNSAIDELFE